MTCVTADEMSGLVNLSFAHLKLNQGALEEPIWHPNANKIGYCPQGDALVSMCSPGSSDVFTVSEGDVFFIPKGYIHHLANNRDKENTILFA